MCERLGLGVLKPAVLEDGGPLLLVAGLRALRCAVGQWPLCEALHEAATQRWEGVGRVGPISVPLWVVARWESV